MLRFIVISIDDADDDEDGDDDLDILGALAGELLKLFSRSCLQTFPLNIQMMMTMTMKKRQQPPNSRKNHQKSHQQQLKTVTNLTS